MKERIEREKFNMRLPVDIINWIEKKAKNESEGNNSAVIIKILRESMRKEASVADTISRKVAEK
jgi:hypothetical protein